MAKKKIKEIIEDMLSEYLEEHELELWNVEFVKEVKDWFLRVYIDKTESSEEKYVSIQECEDVSRFLSEKLDNEDPIEQNYYLEVSSPGMDRELITSDHFRRYIGELVDIKLYKAYEGKKEITAKLKGFDNEILYLTSDDQSEIQIERSQVAKVKLTIVF